jgi:hypothetical protein
MKLLNSATLAALFLSSTLIACTVGDSGANRPGGGEAADAGAVVDNPDAEVPVAQVQWSPETVDQLGIKAAMHYVSPNEIYAIVDEKICMWNGTAWVDHTLPATGLATTMHFVLPNQIYSVVGNKVCMWNGTAWIDMTIDVAGIQDVAGAASIHWVSDNEIYAVVNDTIMMSPGLGNAWVDMTLPMLGMEHEMQMGLDGAFYAVVGTEIQKWTPDLLGELALGVWAVVAPANLGLRPAIQVVSDLEIYAVIGEKVCKSDGLAWVDLTDDMLGLMPAFMRTADDDIHAMAGLAVSHWALPLP